MDETDEWNETHEWNEWKTDTFKKWLIEHNRLLQYYLSKEGTLYSETTRESEHDDIDIWEYLLDKDYMNNLRLDYSDANLDALFEHRRDDYGRRLDNYNNYELLIHMYLKEAFLARHTLRNIDFKKKMLLLGDSSRLVTLFSEPSSYKENYIRISSMYDDDDTKDNGENIFDIPQNPQLLRRELNIATGQLNKVMKTIMLVRERNLASPIIASSIFTSLLIDLTSRELEMIYEELQKILLE